MQKLKNIPLGLRELDRWHFWFFRQFEHEKKPRKLPCHFAGNRRMRSHWEQRQNWVSFEEAERQLSVANLDGLGFCVHGLDDESDIIAIDFDNCRDAATGEIDDSIQVWLNEIQSYTEVSPSGKGLRVFVRGDSSDWGRSKCHDAGTELFYTKGYVTVTGDRLEEYPDEILENNEALQELYSNLFPKEYHQSIGMPTAILGTLNERLSIVNELMPWIPNHYAEEYDGWLKVGMSLHWTLKDAGGLDIWHEWSRDFGGESYSGEQIIIEKWASFDSDRQAVRTIRTLEALATEGGWDRKTSKAARLETSQIDPRSAAEQFIAAHTVDGVCKFAFYKGEWYGWENGKYEHQHWKNSLRRQFGVALSNWYRGVTPNFTNAVADLASAMVMVGQDSPSWIGEDPPKYDATECLVCQNAIIHLPSEARPIPPTPQLFSLTACPVSHNPQAKEPERWLDFLESLWGDREDYQEHVDALQAWFGYCLTADTSLQKMMIIHGESGSGKSVIARVLTDLLGKQSVTGTKLSNLSSPFGLEPLVSSSLAILSDMRPSKIDHGMVETILTIVGEDTVPVNRKHQTIEAMRLRCKLLGLCNSIPELPDESGALLARYVLLQTYKRFRDTPECDTDLEAKLKAELPGILNWAIEGHKLLREKGLAEPANQRPYRDAIEHGSSPVRSFARLCLSTENPEAEILCSDLYAAYVDWHVDAMDKDPEDGPSQFGVKIREAIPDLRRAKAKASKVSGVSKRAYFGLELI